MVCFFNKKLTKKELCKFINIYFTGEAWAKTLGIKNAKVYRISGLQKVDEYDIIEGEGVRTKTTNDDDQNLNYSE